MSYPDCEGKAHVKRATLFLHLGKHHGRMNYRQRLRRGLPTPGVGSGQIEGLCKNTLNQRLRKNSPRWRPERADHMAALCCLDTMGPLLVTSRISATEMDYTPWRTGVTIFPGI